MKKILELSGSFFTLTCLNNQILDNNEYRRFNIALKNFVKRYAYKYKSKYITTYRTSPDIEDLQNILFMKATEIVNRIFSDLKLKNKLSTFLYKSFDNAIKDILKGMSSREREGFASAEEIIRETHEGPIADFWDSWNNASTKKLVPDLMLLIDNTEILTKENRILKRKLKKFIKHLSTTPEELRTIIAAFQMTDTNSEILNDNLMQVLLSALLLSQVYKLIDPIEHKKFISRIPDLIVKRLDL